MENDKVYDVKIGTNTRKGTFQCHQQMCVKSKNSEEELCKYYKNKYHGFIVVVKEMEAVDVACESKLYNEPKYGNKILRNRQEFIIKDYVAPEINIKWESLMAEKARLEVEVEKEIHSRLEQRMEVKAIKEIVLKNRTFSCVIEIKGDLWQV